MAEIVHEMAPGAQLYLANFDTEVELANAMFEYLEIFHNRQRRHSALGMHTPIEYEILQSHPPVVA